MAPVELGSSTDLADLLAMMRGCGWSWLALLVPLALDDCLETEDELHVASLLKLGVCGGVDGGGEKNK